MKRFLHKIFVFISILLGSICTGLILPIKGKDKPIDYSIHYKHLKLNSVSNTKIILTGGSNVLFGFDSEIIQNQTNIPVVNHAINAGYGLKYIIDDLLPYINKGDIILLSPEYSHFLENNYLGREPLLNSLTVDPGNIKKLSMSQIWNILPYVPKFSINRIKSFVYSNITNRHKSYEVYSSNAINEFGDNVAHWDKPKKNFTPYQFHGSINGDTFKMLKYYEKVILEKGAQLFVTHPSLSYSTFQVNSRLIAEIEKNLRELNFVVLDQPKDLCYPNDLFYDTPYHLNQTGALKRSNFIIHKLDSISSFQLTRISKNAPLQISN